MNQMQADLLFSGIVKYTMDVFPEYLLEMKTNSIYELFDIYEIYCWSKNPHYISMYCAVHYAEKYKLFKKEA